MAFDGWSEKPNYIHLSSFHKKHITEACSFPPLTSELHGGVKRGQDAGLEGCTLEPERTAEPAGE